MILSFNGMVRVHDGRPFEGFAIAGEDRHFVPANAEFLVTGKDDRGREQKDERRLKVWSPLVPNPVAVRYAWARNPLGNAVNSGHHERIIPIPSFRTDEWDWPEAPFESDSEEARNEHREAINKMRQQARQWAEDRPLREALVRRARVGLLRVVRAPVHPERRDPVGCIDQQLRRLGRTERHHLLVVAKL